MSPSKVDDKTQKVHVEIMIHQKCYNVKVLPQEINSDRCVTFNRGKKKSQVKIEAT